MSEWASPAQRLGKLGRQLASANATHRFAPPDGMDFFRPYGWAPVEVRSSWREAIRLGRLPRWLRLVAAITPPSRRDPYYSIARVALLERAQSGEADLSRLPEAP